MVGATISHYKITAKLGEGGMGVVYKAEDTPLKRSVALKFLATSALGDEDQKARFLREAQSVALLDHPNIAGVHDIGEQDGRTFMAIAFVDGPELAAKIKERPLKLEEALDIAIQICEGLKEAHEKGVTHRDIKPANIMLTQKGRVKVTDFGLAHLAGRSKLTKSGTSLGTPAYMSPEQALGDSTDRRSDIWGVGVVLYEMIAGKIPFSHEHEQAIIYSIINEQQEPLTALRTGLPTELDRVIGKALAKKPAERYQHIDDFLVDLRRLRKGLATETKSKTIRPAPVTSPEIPPSPVTAARPFAEPQPERPSSGRHAPLPRSLPTWKMRLPWVLFGAAAIGLVIVGFEHLSEEQPAKPLRKFTITPPPPAILEPVRSFDAMSGFGVSISPNGRHVAYATREGLWVHDLDRGQSRLLERTDGVARPFWSPDSNFIGFAASEELKKISTSGGDSVRICGMRSRTFFGGAWSPDGRTKVFVEGAWPVLFEVSASGGDPEERLSRAKLEAIASQATDVLAAPRPLPPRLVAPQFLPSKAGPRLLLLDFGFGGGQTMAVIDLETDRAEILGRGGAPVYSPSGHLVYHAGRDLWAVPFSLASLQTTGDAFVIAQDAYSPGVANDGTLIYVDNLRRSMQATWRDRNGLRMGSVGEVHEDVQDVRLSHDGQQLALSAKGDRTQQQWAFPNGEIWLYDLERNHGGRFTNSPAFEYRPTWSPSGNEIAYSSNLEGDYDIYLRETNGGDQEQRLVGHGDREWVADWSLDGKYILYRRNTEETNLDLWYLERAEDGSWEPHPFLRSPFSERQAQFSPNSRFVVYTSNESDQDEIYVRSFPDGAGEWRISRNGGSVPRWSGDGDELFFVGGGAFYAVRVSLEPEFRTAEPVRLYDFASLHGFAQHNYHYDVSHDGQGILAAEPVGDPPRPRIHVAMNWYEEFRDRQLPIDPGALQ